MMKKLLSLMLVMLAFVGMAKADGVTDLDDLSNQKAYYLHSSRGYFTINSEVESGTILTSTYYTWWNWISDDTNADGGSKFAILEVDDDLYLYSVSAQKFVNPDKTLSVLPPKYTESNKMNFMATASTTYPWVLAYGEQQFNISNTDKGVSYRNDLTDAGNMIAIEEVEAFDPTDALAQFDVETHTVTFNVMYNGSKVDSETFENVPGTEVTFDKTYALTTITGTTTATIGEEDQTIELTATVSTFSTEDNPTYYYIKSGNGSTYLKDNGDGNALTWESGKLNMKPYKFAIIGSPFSGTTYLKSKSGNYAYSATPDDEYGSDAKVYSSATNHTDYTATGAGTSGVEGAFGLRTTGHSYSEYIFAGNRISTNLSYSSYWDAGENPSKANQVLQIEEAETEDITTVTWTVSAPEETTVTIGGVEYSNGDTFEGSADLTADNVTVPEK